MSESTVKSFLSRKTLIACSPRAVSPPVSTYGGKSSFFGLSGPAADHGELFELYSQPALGFSRCGVSSTERSPCQSVAGLLPSTGFVQSKVVSRRGMKFEWKYAMSPSASAKIVLFDELVCSSIVCRNSL